MEKTQIITPKILQEIFIEDRKQFEIEQAQPYSEDFSNFIKKQVFRVLGGKFKFTAPIEKIDGKKIKKILIFRYDAVGDYFVSTGAFRWLKAAMPNAQIDVVTSTRNDNIIKNDPNVNRTYCMEFTSGYNLSWFRTLGIGKGENYDLVLALVFSKTTKAAFMARVIAPKAEKISVLTSRNREFYGYVFSRLSKFFIPGISWANKMSSCAWAHISPARPTQERDKDPYIYIKKENFEVVREIIVRDRLNFKPNCENILLPSEIKESDMRFDGSDYCVINFLGFEADRQWDEAQCADYSRRLIAEYPNLKIYITGMKSDEARVDKVLECAKSDKCRKIMLPLQDFNLFLAGAKFLVSVDTSLVHIAAAAKIPILGLYHKTKFRLWFPHKSPFAIAVSPILETINAIDNDTLIEATELLLNEIAPNYKAEDYSF